MPSGTVTPQAAGGGSASLVHLGTIDLTALVANGPRTLWTPAADTFNYLFVLAAGFVDLNTPYSAQAGFSTGVDPIVGFPSATLEPMCNIAATARTASNPFQASTTNKANLADGSAVKLYLITTTNFRYITAPCVAWQANHVYAALAMILGPDNHVWSTDAGGTSGGSIPNFAANEGGTVADNTVTWADEGAIPTAGAVTLAYLKLT